MITATHCSQCPRLSAETPLSVGPALSHEAFAAIRQSLLLDHCKWDPQVEDRSTLAPFPLIMSTTCWARLAKDAEELAAQTIRAEEYLLTTPHLWPIIGVPRKLRRALAQVSRLGPTPAAVRVMRFDFHFTTTGWRISEVNSDVPGGYCESSSFTRLIAAHFPALHTAGDPAQTWVDAMARLRSGPIALLCAPGFMEDQQVVSYLAQRLRVHGCDAILSEPRQLRWHDGHAHLNDTRLSSIVRFYQAEWLTALPRSSGWENLLAGGRTPVTNAGTSLLTESKRFPLTWDALPTPTHHWRRLLPETRDPRDTPWRSDDAWLLKTAYCNTGDTVTIRGLAPQRAWRAAARSARWFPSDWVAQRRFKTLAVDSPIGPLHPCVGVYVIDGRAAGAYGRLSPTPVIDYAATDVAVLVEQEGNDDDQG